LDCEQIACVTVEPASPEVRVGLGIDQLGINSELVVRPPDASLQYVMNPEFAPDLPRIDWPVAIGEGGVAGNDEQIRDA
jgi:hypothetical protein